MQSHAYSRAQSSIIAILGLLLSACAPIKTPADAPTNIALPAPVSTSQAALTPTPLSEPTLGAITPTGGTLSSNTTCSQAEIEQYEKDILPLADEHANDSNQAKKMEELTDETQIRSFADRAAERMKNLQTIQAPPCLREAHEKLLIGFDLLIKTWDLIKNGDYSAAATTLRNSYEAVYNGLAKIEVLKLGL